LYGGVLCAALALAGEAMTQALQLPISPEARAAFDAITAHPLVKKGLAALEADDADTLEDQKRITVIPAPPFKEQARAE
jgi:hypothetical protein